MTALAIIEKHLRRRFVDFLSLEGYLRSDHDAESFSESKDSPKQHNLRSPPRVRVPYEQRSVVCLMAAQSLQV